MATRDLHEKIGSVEFEKLFAGMLPQPIVKPGTIRKLGTAGTLKRGTLLAKSSGTGGDGKLVIFGTTAGSNETLTADCVLCDDIEVGTTDDENAAVYVSGHFNEDALIVATGATIAEADRDELRKRGILLGTVMEP